MSHDHAGWKFAFLLATAAAVLAAGCNSSEEPAERARPAAPVAANTEAPDDPQAKPAGGGFDASRFRSPDDGGAAPSGDANAALPVSFRQPVVKPAASSPETWPVVVVKTSHGEIRVQLNPDKAPGAVDNFLENYVEREFYDNTIFHHVDKGFMLLAGGFDTQLKAKPVRAEIFNEADNGLKNVRGAIAMTRRPKYAHSATSQFFFNLVDNPKRDHRSRDKPEDYGYCVFGKVIAGMDVLDRIAEVSVHEKDGFAKLPVEPVVIHSIRKVK